MASFINQMDSLVILLAAIMAFTIYSRNTKRSSLPCPPGPKRVPLLGNLLNFPSSSEWITYDKWCKELDSDIIYLSVLGNEFVILNSMDAVNDLFEKRSSIYSSRPKLGMPDLMGWGWLISVLEYGEAWRVRRRHFTKYLNPSKTVHHAYVTEFVRGMLPSLLDKPENFLEIARHAVAGFSLKLAYGFTVEKEKDPYIGIAEKALKSVNVATLPGNFLVNVLPILSHVPDWFPGAGFKKKAREWRKLQDAFREEPFARTIKDMHEGVSNLSLATAYLELLNEANLSQEEYVKEETIIKDTAGMIYNAAADTTLSSTQTLFAAMLCFPDVQKKAQEELDRVLGGRLPELSDEKNLPYITALVKELLRWHPIVPLAMPHMTTEDDVYRGYYVPKGSYVMANSWSLLQDEKYFPKPTVFDPDRFLKDGKLNPEVRDPNTIIFGYGRRICPGSHVALSFLWLAAATILATFNISRSTDETGNEIEPHITFHPGVICEPVPFTCTIKPRSNGAEGRIHNLK